MKFTALSGLVALVSVGTSTSQFTPNGQPASSWEYVASQSDEFASRSLDTSKWSQSLGDWKGSAPGFFVDSNVALASGSLRLTARVDTGVALADTDQATCGCNYAGVTTSLVRSTQKLGYGYYEWQAQMADASILSALWLQGSSGEINVFETVPSSLSNGRVMSTNYHCFDTNDAAKTKSSEQALAGFDPTGVHTYGLERTADYIKVYVDGSLKRTVTSSGKCFTETMYVIMTMETSEAEGVPTAGTFNSDVRHFRYFTPRVATATVAHVCAMQGVVSPRTPQSCGLSRKVNNGCIGKEVEFTKDQVEAKCIEQGARLCTLDELLSGVGMQTGCSLDYVKVPSSTSCKPNKFWATNGGGTGRAVCKGPNKKYPVRCCASVPGQSAFVRKSSKTCRELGWDETDTHVDKVGSRYQGAAVCARSMLSSKKAPEGKCYKSQGQPGALSKCAKVKARLCTQKEVESGITVKSGCGLDYNFIHTSTQCSVGGKPGFVAVKGHGRSYKCIDPLGTEKASVRCCADKV